MATNSNSVSRQLHVLADGATKMIRDELGINYKGITQVVVDSTAGALTYTAAQFLSTLIARDPNGAGRADTTPTAAEMVAALYAGIGEVLDGDTNQLIETIYINTANAAETLTITAGSGVTLVGDATVAQNETRHLYIRFTDTKPGQEAVTIYIV